ncbi:MAG: hypothetical protein Q7S34_02220 [bacterium]|nr:hypothetical protein [bacterium]
MKTNKGYAGLLALLITAVVITFLVWQTYGKKGQNQKTVIEEDLQAINQAQDIKDTLEKNSRQTAKEIQ